MAMNPTASGTKGTNTHTYPAYDYPVPVGTGLVACKDGVFTDLPGDVTRRLIGHLQNGNAWPIANQGIPNSGNVLTISHDNGEYTCYLHASPYNVNDYRGKRVSKGEVFARSGHNGWSTGPHLHFEVWKNGVRIDPGAWLNNISTGGGNMDNESEVGQYEVDALCKGFFGYPASAADYTEHMGKESNGRIRWFFGNPAYLAREKYLNDLIAENARLKQQIANGAGSEFVETKVYVKKG